MPEPMKHTPWTLLNVRQLAYLLAVVDEGSFTAAAQRLHLSQPALSRQVRELEQHIGGALLERRRGGLVPTATGRAFLPEARAVVAAAERAMRVARDSLGLEGGTLELATLATLASGRLLPALSEWRRLHPHVRTRLREFTFRGELEEYVAGGGGDLAIGTLSQPWDGPAVSLGWEEFVLVLPPGDPLLERPGAVALDALAERDWVGYDPQQGLARLMGAACAAAGFEPREAVRTSQVEAAARFAAAGLGLALVPAGTVPGDLAACARRLDPPVAWEISAYARTELDHAAQSFIALATATASSPRPHGALELTDR
ncbi:LysR family transcriptional regulator [Streptomyces iconiensis]|uniref:LysR family transcriptional regulator n=1 Tax=Streptomyces iconiensis TaxID=1384038 RepID=A0ABT6ZVK4_9ACTN|nr:LysR family transcriptional regulator [Streptomyces iconiensis]MDJ1133096.1 LysR family transcriptional regulator [Streptomyces iconiensis]